jgi:putative flippase GtrA
MTPDLKGFSRYSVIGVANTFIHWLVFAVLCLTLGVRQSLGNLMGFIVAGSFSFLVNGRYTFRRAPSWQAYLSFMAFMGLMSLAVGHLGDMLGMAVLLTFMVSSSINLSLGYCYSKYVVFRR